jgi:hypothetical protein
MQQQSLVQSFDKLLKPAVDKAMSDSLRCPKDSSPNVAAGAASDGADTDCHNGDIIKTAAETEAEKAADEKKAIVERTQVALLRRMNDLKDLQNAFVSTMQLWVEQSDPERMNVFYSPEPARISFLPLSSDHWKDAPFEPWQFESADANSVTLEECNYLPDTSAANIFQRDVFVSLLGVRSWSKWLAENEPNEQVPGRPDWARLAPGDSPRLKCGNIKLPTAALATDPIVLQMEFPPHPQAIGTNDESTPPLRTTVTISKSRLGPYFRQPEIRSIEKISITDAKPPVKSKLWDVVIPVDRSTCADIVELPDGLVRGQTDLAKHGSRSGAAVPDLTKIESQWQSGETELASCSPAASANDKNRAVINWKAADDAARISLHLEIPRAAINDLPDRVSVVRTTSDGVPWVVATLPDLRGLLLPSRLTLDSLSATQFTLRGKNAVAIDAVAMQSSTDGSATTLPAATGVDFALVTLPAQSTATTSPDTSGSGSGSSNSTSITIDTTKDNTDKVVMTQSSSSTPPKAPATGNNTPNKPSATEKAATTKAFAPGSYAVIPLIQIGSAPPDKSKLDAVAAAVKKENDAKAKVAAAEKAVAAAKAAASATGASVAAPTKAPAPGAPPATGGAKGSAQAGTTAPGAPPATGGAKGPAQAGTTAPGASPATGGAKGSAQAGTTAPGASPATGGAKGSAQAGTTAPGAPKTPSPEAELLNAQQAEANAEVDATKAAQAAEPTPIYMPLSVTDDKGKPLIFTVADPKKQAASTTTSTTPASATPTCATSCVALPCTAVCPQTSSPAAPPKSQ